MSIPTVVVGLYKKREWKTGIFLNSALLNTTLRPDCSEESEARRDIVRLIRSLGLHPSRQQPVEKAI